MGRSVGGLGKFLASFTGVTDLSLQNSPQALVKGGKAQMFVSEYALGGTFF